MSERLYARLVQSLVLLVIVVGALFADPAAAQARDVPSCHLPGASA